MTQKSRTDIIVLTAADVPAKYGYEVTIMIYDAEWITAEVTGAEPEFFRTFKTAGKVAEARLAVTAIGVYEVTINGKRVGDAILAPGCTAYNKRLQYQEYDVTDMIAGENTIAAAVGRGWHRSRMSENRPEINGKPCALIAELSLTYENGETEYIRTDEAWCARASRTTESDIWDGETYDASLPEGDAVPAVTAELGKDILIPQEGEPVREHEIFAPRALIVTPKGERVLDFGQNITGYVKLDITAHEGETVTLSCAEILDSDGNFYNENYRTARSQMKYICREGRNAWKPRFTFYGFRYIRLDGFPEGADPMSLRAVAVYTDMARTGYIRTSEPELNRFFENVLWSQRDNFLDIPTDCPQRDERMGWTGDAQVFALTACYNYDAKSFFEKWLGDVRAEQRENGSVPDTVPNFWKLGGASTAWGDAVTVIPWTLYMMYGDKGVLEKNFDAMKRWVDYITNDTLDEYLWTSPDDSRKKWRKHYGDWLALDAPYGSFHGISSDNFIASAFYAYSTELLVKAGEATGRDMSEYRELHENIVSKFKETFTEYKTQTECVLALHFGLTDRPAETAAKLNEMIRENGTRLKTGFVGTPYLLHALSDNGYADTAFDLLLQTDYPSWLYEVEHGATTIWEHWDGIRDDGTLWSTEMNSYNHYSYGSVMDWVYRKAAGIRPGAPGFREAVIAPLPSERIGCLEAEYRTAYGKIISRRTNTAEGVCYEIETPVPSRIIIDGETHEVGAGRYTFWGEPKKR